MADLDSILMIITNPFTYDLRPRKEVKTLEKLKHKIYILGWDRENKYKAKEKFTDKVTIFRFKVKSKYGQTFIALVHTILFYFWALKSALKLNFKIVHCHDVATVPIGIALKIIKLGRIKVIYDMHDHPIIYINQFPFSKILEKILFFLIKVFVDYVIVVNDMFVQYLVNQYKIKQDKIICIMNVPEKSVELKKRMKEPKPKKNLLRIFYYGNLSPLRNVDKLCNAVKGLDKVTLYIAGRGELEDFIKKTAKRYSNIVYLGWISTNEIENILRKNIDLVVALYRPTNINNRFASPGKLFTAMAYRLPIVVTENTFMGQIVRKFKCGITINDKKIGALRMLFTQLVERQQLLKKLGENGYVAFKKEFNWENMENKLLSLYKKLFSE